MIFGVLGDIHITSVAPSSRIDGDFTSFQLSLLTSLVNAMKAAGAQAILLPGDVLNRRRLPDSGRNKALGGLIKVIRESEVPWFTTIGQHDVLGQSSRTYPTASDLKLVEDACNGLLTVLYNGSSALIGGVAVYGFAYGDEAQQKLFSNRFPVPNIPSVALIHASVYPEPFMDYFTVAELQDWGFKLQVHGDIHEGFSPITLGSNHNSLAMNAGVMTWMKRDEAAKCVPARFNVVEVTSEGARLLASAQMAHPRPEDCFDFTIDEGPLDLTSMEVCVEQAFNAMTEARALRGVISEQEVLSRMAEATNNRPAYEKATTYLRTAEAALEKLK